MNKWLKKIKKIMCRNWEDYAKYCSEIGVKMGENCSICTSVYFGSEPYLIKLGDNVRISSDVLFITHDGGIHVIRKDEYKNADLYGSIEIGNNVFIGTRATIMPKVKIGDNCVIGAGSIVTKDIPSNSIAAGVPARVINSVEKYKEKNINSLDYTHGMDIKEKERYLRNKYNF